ncbi:MAG TPA: OmpA family protein [Chitinophagales bacterium]|nr:OmpA family protein [Chitinophagales bacterium]HMV03574.1 OmpA family protein [Chitinophagales bacterium]HMW94527.1 OmpA family protein [Chitinophagales bacterium]HMY43651.1 OmpA family protein [Chitinophagales bacterium]HMZ68365.1 OmpA family protein [Chitinophagales bacterium]
MNGTRIIGLVVLLMMLQGCVTKKKYLATETQKDNIQLSLNQTTSDLAKCEKKFGNKVTDYNNLNDELAKAQAKIKELNKEIDYQKNSNVKLLDQLSNLSVISKEGAESIKKSLEAIDRQNQEINNLNAQIRTKDSLNLALVMNLKRSLDDVNDQEVDVQVQKGVVLISLSDKMLYKSGSYEITATAGTVLGKIAKIINDYKTFDVLIEGNTDNVPIKNNCITDNWDLSAKRATSIARALQLKYGVDPSRIIAGGRSEFYPKVANDTPANRSINRRTEIIIMPKLDEFFKLLEIKPTGN